MNTENRNSSFSLERFCRYFSFETRQTVRQQGLAILASGLVPLMLLSVFALFSVFAEDDTAYWEQYSMFSQGVAALIFIMFFLVFPIIRYGYITDRINGNQYLMLPASTTEKLLSSFIITTIAVPAVFMALYFTSDWLSCIVAARQACSMESDGVIHEVKPLIEQLFSDGVFMLSEYNGSMTVSLTNVYLFFLPCMVSAAGYAGALIFRKRKTLYTFLICAGSFILFIALCIHLIDILEIDQNSLKQNMSAYWYTFQTAVTAILWIFIIIRTRKVQL